jgi:hypothetical protein
MIGSTFTQVCVALVGSLAGIALILTALGLALGIVNPGDALRRAGAVLGVVMLLMALSAVLISVWSSMPVWQHIGLVAITLSVWQWLRPRRRTRNAKHD